ncbi:hypothetical protein GCM10010207_85870 [Streptomyces atratus]|nr:hypothetical protein GCM10010207_85870 [Streptomyces atratus]
MKQRFLDLVHEGVSIREASRVVGINRRTGQEWLNGRAERVTVRGGNKAIRAAVQPVVGAPRTFPLNPRRGELKAPALPVSSRYLSEEERIRIADLRREKKSIRSIAAALGRSPSTVGREIRRNCNPNVRPTHPSYYRPFTAQKRAESRRPRPKTRRVETCPWSPRRLSRRTAVVR